MGMTVQVGMRVCVYNMGVCTRMCVCSMCVYICVYVYVFMGFPGGRSGKEPACQCKRCREETLISGSGRSPAAGDGYPTPVFLPGEFHRQRSLAG